MSAENRRNKIAQHWIASRRFDLIWILGPAFFSVVLALVIATLLPNRLNTIPIWTWALVIMGIDVAHVYSTLFRTYFDPEERRHYSGYLLMIPLMCWLLGVLLYSQSTKGFWTVLAYVAVFHFVRQQYGFMMIYRRSEPIQPRLFRALDQLAVYLATLFPLVYWHAHLPRNFIWFVKGDFAISVPQWISSLCGILYGTVLIAYLIKELYQWRREHYFNVPKNLLLFGTALSWYVGIVLLNADFPFTITNVITHGVPYIALVWYFGRRKFYGKSRPTVVSGIFPRFFSYRAIPLFALVLIVLAYFEEGFWDSLVWRERQELFSIFYVFGAIPDHAILSMVVPLLAVPQATHYVLDAFIWRMRKPDRGFAEILHGARSL